MSPQRARLLKEWLTIALPILGLCGSGGVWARSEFRASLNTKVDTAAYSRDRALRTVRDSDEHELLLDVLCSKHVDPQNRRCPHGVR